MPHKRADSRAETAAALADAQNSSHAWSPESTDPRQLLREHPRRHARRFSGVGLGSVNIDKFSCGPRPQAPKPRSPQACQRGASPRRILVSLGGLLTAVAESTPPRRSWMSPLGARPLADRFQTTTRRKSTTRSVTFLRDPTIPFRLPG